MVLALFAIALTRSRTSKMRWRRRTSGAGEEENDLGEKVLPYPLVHHSIARIRVSNGTDRMGQFLSGATGPLQGRRVRCAAHFFPPQRRRHQNLHQQPRRPAAPRHFLSPVPLNEHPNSSLYALVNHPPMTPFTRFTCLKPVPAILPPMTHDCRHHLRPWRRSLPPWGWPDSPPQQGPTLPSIPRRLGRRLGLRGPTASP